MKKLLFTFLFFSFAQNAFASSCGGKYKCTSGSGIYEIEIQRCQGESQLGSATLKIAGVDVPGVKVGPSWDGELYLAFELRLPDQNGQERHFSVETDRETARGIIQEKLRTIGRTDWRDSWGDSISCEARP